MIYVLKVDNIYFVLVIESYIYDTVMMKTGRFLVPSTTSIVIIYFAFTFENAKEPIRHNS